MTINDMINQGITFQGERRITAMADDGSFDEITLYEDCEEWFYSPISEDWGEWEINYIYAGHYCLIIELDNPNS